MAFVKHQLVRFQHCDPAGIVFYPRYFEMMNATVEDWFETRLGHPFAELHGPMAATVPTAGMTVTFSAPSRLGDRLEIALHLRRLGRSSAGLEFVVTCEGELRMTMTSAVVYVGVADGRPQPWPQPLRARMEPELDAPA